MEAGLKLAGTLKRIRLFGRTRKDLRGSDRRRDEHAEFARLGRRIAEGRLVSRREKLIEKMRRTPGSIRFAEVETLLRHEGFVLFNTRGSHRTYHDASGRVLTLVRPHGGRKTCDPDDIKTLLEVLGL